MKNFSFLQRMFLLLFVGISMFAVQSCNEEELERKPFVGAWTIKHSDIDTRSVVYEFKSDGTFKRFLLFEETKTGIYSYNENLQTLTFSYSDGSTSAYILTTLSDNYFVLMSQKTAESYTYYRRDVDPKGLYDTFTSETINGHEVVDLGLSVKWSTCNIGASSWEKVGNYYAWGEIAIKNSYTEDNYKWYREVYDKWGYIDYWLTKYCTYDWYGDVDNKTTLEAADDAATVKWGSRWHIPTKNEVEELYDNCEQIATKRNGVNGSYFLAANGNYIFIPNDDIWTSTTDGNHNSRYFCWNGGNCSSGSRYYGRNIRPVYK